jgi:hypothetical protein
MPCGNRSPGDQFPKLYVLGFAVSCVSTGVCCDHGLIYLTMVCSSGAKCSLHILLAYSDPPLLESLHSVLATSLP